MNSCGKLTNEQKEQLKEAIKNFERTRKLAEKMFEELESIYKQIPVNRKKTAWDKLCDSGSFIFTVSERLSIRHPELLTNDMQVTLKLYGWQHDCYIELKNMKDCQEVYATPDQLRFISKWSNNKE